jgi:hypothetical protein
MQTYGNEKYVFVGTPEKEYTFDTDGNLLSDDSAPERVHTQVVAYLAEE